MSDVDRIAALIRTGMEVAAGKGVDEDTYVIIAEGIVNLLGDRLLAGYNEVGELQPGPEGDG